VGDPLALAVLCLIGLSGDQGLAEDEALLRLTPELTPAAGRIRLERAISELERAAGTALVRRTGSRLAIDPDAVALDVTLAPEPNAEAGPDADRFLAGFALPAAPEFAEWVAAVRPRVRRVGPAPGRTVGRRRQNRRLIALLTVVGAAVGAAIFAARPPSPPPGFVPGEPVLLADLDNATGDTLFDRSLITAAAVALRQSAQLSLVSQERIRGALGRMGYRRPDTARVLGPLAREVAMRENVGYTLGFRIELAGQGYQLTGELVDARTGEVLAAPQAGAETRAGTLIALDQLVQAIRTRLGEPQALRRSRSLPLPQVTTPSLEALRAYGLGAGAWSRGDYQLAGQLWERALDIDSGFAMAMVTLGAHRYYHHDRAEGQRLFQEAARRADRLTDWERLELERSHALFRGDYDSATVMSRTLVERFPTADSWANYGTALMSARRYDSAIAALERAAALDSTPAIFINLATSAGGLRRLDAAIGYYQRAEALDSIYVLLNNVNTEYGDALVLAGRLAEAERLFRRMLDQPELFRRTLGYRALGLLGVWRGTFDQAVGFFRQATEASRQQRARNSTARGYLFEGLTLLLTGDTTAARQALDSMVRVAESSTLDPQILALLGNGLLRAGQVEPAERLLRRGRAGPDTTSQSIVESNRFLAAAIALAQGRSRAALEALTGLGHVPQSHLVAVRRAEALAATGDTARARASLDSVVAQPSFGSESLFEWIEAVRLGAELAARQGDREAALAGYQKLVRQWSAGDSTAAVLVQARRRVRELEGRR
jgi:tetratricopeptide (TPR) repeat protein